MRWCTFTVTCVPLIVTVTPLGIGTGCLPIRDSLHSITGLHDRADCNLGCCGLKAATRPLKLLCIHCICAMVFRLREQNRSRFPASCVEPVPSDCPICLQGFLTLAFNVSLPFALCISRALSSLTDSAIHRDNGCNGGCSHGGHRVCQANDG